MVKLAKKKKRFWKISIFIFVLLAIGITATVFIVQQTGLQLRDNYRRYSDLDDQFTDYWCGSYCISLGLGRDEPVDYWDNKATAEWINCGTRSNECESKFWFTKIENQPGISLTRGFIFTGGENKVSFSRADLTFKGEVFKRRVKIPLTCLVRGAEGGLPAQPCCSISIGGKSCEICTSSKLLFEIHPNPQKPEEINLICNGEPAGTTTINSESKIHIDGSGTVEDARYQLLYERCKLSNDESPLVKEFAEETTFNTDDLPGLVRLCDAQQIVFKRLDTGGLEYDPITSTNIFYDLLDGKDVKVEKGFVMRVPYVGERTAEMPDCDYTKNQAINQEGECIDMILIDPEEEPATELTIIELGTNEFSYIQKYNTPDLVIGEIVFDGGTPSFDCRFEERSYHPPNPRKECWKTETSVGVLNPKDEFKINPYIKGEYDLSGYVVEDKIWNEEDWTNVFKFTIDTEGLRIIKSEIKGGKAYLTIENNLANFNENQAGVKIKYKTLLYETIRDEYFDLALKKGTEEYVIPDLLDVKGKVRVSFISYMIINSNKDKTVFGSTQLAQVYEDGEEIEKFTEELPEEGEEETIDVEEEVKESWFTKGRIFTIVIIAIVIIVIIGAIFYFKK